MKRYLVVILIILGIIFISFMQSQKQCPLSLFSPGQETDYLKAKATQEKVEPWSTAEALNLLKSRKDRDALIICEMILATEPNNLDALWGKAEAKRRIRKFSEAEIILSGILRTNPNHIPSMITLSYIKYKDDKLNEALNLINRVLKDASLSYENEALANIMLGTINSKRASEGWLFIKIKYGMQIKRYFLKARDLAPGLPEVHLGLGTFYLLAPSIVGGNLDKAIQELELAIKMAPDFATANARLAQAYKKRGDLKNYQLYLDKARELDPENETLQEIK